MTIESVQGGQAVGSGRPQGDYTVHRGDTLTAIAQRHGVSLAALEAANPQIANPDRILTGQQIHLPGGSAGVSAGASVGASASQPVSGPHADAAAVAEQYIGRNASALEHDRGDRLPMRDGVDTHHCCANFVSAVLVEAGQLPAGQQTTRVSELNHTLRADGWTEVSAANARPGDVVIIQGSYHGHPVSHTEMVSGPGQMIGSNNRNADHSQRVTHDNLNWAIAAGGVILRAPASVAGSGAASPAGTAAPAAGPAPAGTGSLATRQAEAVRYFEGQGWTHAQASGIVANLTRESQLSPGARGDGGLAYGLGQWHPDRQAEFQRFTGHSIQGSSFGEQLAFVNHELRTTERSAGNQLHNATTAAQAGSTVSQHYERPGDRAGEASARAQLATQIAASTR